jgi:PIN domain nuclease of toxin-antitoxin system
MPSAVTDTHALIWYLNDDPRLSPRAASYFQGCEDDGGRILVPAICVVEIVYLSEKGRIPPDTLNSMLRDLSMDDTILEVVGLSLPITLELPKIARSSVPDMPDRIIAATASYFQLPLLSRDGKIKVSGLNCVW